MGYNTGIMILNDAWGDIENNLEEWWNNLNQIHNTPCDKGYVSFSAGCHGNASSLFHNSHADYTGVYCIGGNFVSKLGDFYGSDHRDSLKVLRQLAANLGYTLIPTEDIKRQNDTLKQLVSKVEALRDMTGS